MQFACFLIYIYKWRVKSRYQKAGKERQRDTATDYNIQFYSYKTADDCNTDYNIQYYSYKTADDCNTDYNIQYYSYKTADDCNTDYNAVAEKKESKERDAATDYNTDYRRY